MKKVSLKENIIKTFHVLHVIREASKGFLIVFILQAIFTSITPYVSIYFTYRIIDGVVDKIPSSEIMLFAYLMIGINFIIAIITNLLDYFNSIYSVELSYNLDTKIALKTFELDYELLEDNATMKMIEMAEEGCNGNGDPKMYCEQILRGLLSSFLSVLYGGFLLLGLLSIKETSNSSLVVQVLNTPWSALSILFALFIPTVISKYVMNRNNEKSYNIMMMNIDGNRKIGYFCQICANYKYGKDIRLYKLKDWFNNILISLTKQRIIIAKKIEQRYILANVSNSIFLLIRDLIVFSLLISLVIKGDIDITTFTFLTGIVAGFTLWLNGFVEAANNLRTSTISVKEYRKCLDMKNQLNHGEGRDVSKLDAPFSIEFKNVSFAYPGAEKPTIENLSFKISPGEKVALVGDNGAGKTTIIKLLTGLYIAGEGEILINGYDIHSFNISDYMSLFSVVFQDSEPLSLTIENIITCQRNKEVDQERLYDALEKSGLKEKVLSLERKENTYLTQMFDLSGIRLSGGETQKLMLARALYKDAPLLILDEPTAALDPLAEERMYLQYDKLTEYNTSLFISHRLASTKFCDRVFFLEQGKIVEKGSHDELITLNKKYKETFDIQAKYYKENYDEKN